MNQTAFHEDPVLSARIGAVVEQMTDSLSEGKFIDRQANFREPEEEEIRLILSELRQVIFPGFFSRTRYKVYTERNQLSMLLEDILFRLNRQIGLVLPAADQTEASAAAREQRALDLTLTFLGRLPRIRALLETDLEAAYDGDPAAHDRDEIIYSYPGLYAIFVHRTAHELYSLQIPLIPRMMSEFAHRETGIDINPGAEIGDHFFIDHGTGIVVGETTRIGSHVKLYQGVTLGALSTSGGRALNNVKRHPTIEDGVTLYAGATILGGSTVIGRGAVIGGNAFITSSVPAGTKVSIKNQELLMSGEGPKPLEREEDNGWFYVI